MDTLPNRLTQWLGLTLVLLGLSALSTAHAQPDKTSPVRKDRAKAEIHPSEQVLEVNNAPIWIGDNGEFGAIDPFSGDNDSYPARAGSHIVFAQGLMFGGKVRDGGAGPATPSDTIRTGGSTYDSGLAAGGIDWDPNTGVVNGPETGPDSEFHVYKVDRQWANDAAVREAASYSEGVVNPADVSSSAVTDTRDQYRYDWNNWPAEKGAPYEDCNGDGQYTPADPQAVAEGATCEDLDGDIPGFPGADQTMWVVTNDLGPNYPDLPASEGAYGSPPIGLEIQYTIWGYDRPPGSALGNINFIEAEIIYAGLPDGPSDARIDSMFTTWWVDPDVGTFSNDFAGVDTNRSMGYAYNATATDGDFEQEGLPPGAGGFDFLKGPVNAEGDTLGLSSFVFFASGTDISDPDQGVYEGTLQWYNLMRGRQPRPEYPEGDKFPNSTGPGDRFVLTGDPVSGSGLIDGAAIPPGDRRIVNTSGPFSMTKGDTVSVVIGKINAVGTSNITSVSRLRFFDTAAQFAFDQDFDVPGPPATPSVQAATLDGNVVLNWGEDQELVNRTESYTAPPGYDFEGYRVYQLPSPTASLEDGVRVATFDEQNQVRTLVDNVFEQETGFTVEKPVQSLNNTGIQRFINLRTDEIRDRPLANGVDYYYAVTSFGYLRDEDADVPSRVLESSPARLTVRPQAPSPGTVDSTVASFDQEIPVAKGEGTGNATVNARIVDPSNTVDAEYTVTINESNETWGLQQNETTVLSGQQFTARPDRRTVAGIKIDVLDATFSAPTTFLGTEAVNDPNGSLGFWGDATLFGQPVGYYGAFNPNIPEPPVQDAQQDLIFRFTGNGGPESPTTEGGQLASYCERGAFGAANPLQDFDCNTIRAPFELYERERDRQIQYAIIGRNADGQSPWGNGAAPSDGGYYRMAARDYIVPIPKEYDQQDVEANGTNAGEGSWLLFFFQAGVGGGSSWDQGDVFRINYANPVDSEDTWTFSTESVKTGNEEVASAEVEDISVFPNPYRGFNRLETSRFDKFVRFNNLPNPEDFGETTIRIFTLSGNPVRVLEHDQDSPNANFLDWDLRNQGDIPVASGIYLAYINTPQGEKTLKIAIAQEEEILRRY